MGIKIWARKKEEVSVIKLALLVEDDAINQKIMNFFLSNLGYRVDSVTNANSAIEKIQSKTYDLIIVDIGLPDRPGTDVIEAARQYQLNLATPLIVWSAHINNDVEKYRNLGADAVLEKACLAEDLENAIQDCFLISTYERRFNFQLISLGERWRELDGKKCELAAIDYVEKLMAFFREALKIIEEYHVWLRFYEKQEEVSEV
ncbi:response regulator [Rickettsiella endosymbiont of Miltochrista miniata]|uniref:response regulator n=1 Tax=Rickettsiella endosymbiont of Miltochrista miniata TaxID=3066239 RepID=UPI00313BD9B0